MQFTYESQGTNTFLTYELTKLDNVDSMTMGMVNNNKIEGVIPFSYSQMDSQCFLKYNVSSKISLAQYFNGVVNRRRLIGVMSSIASTVLNAQDYMIEPISFVWDKEYIFVDVSSAEAQLICLPIIRETEEIDLEMFFKSIILGIQFDQTENCDYVARLLGFFNANTMFSLQEFVKMLKELENGKSREDVNGVATQGSINKVSSKASGQNNIAQQDFSVGNIGNNNVSAVSVEKSMETFGHIGSLGSGNAIVQSEKPSQSVNMVSTGIPGQFGVGPSNANNSKNSVVSGQGVQEKSGKKSFSLFGSKKEKEPKSNKKNEKKKVEKSSGIAIPGRSSEKIIPGIPAPSQKGSSIPQPTIINTSQTVQQAIAQQTQISQPVVAQQPAASPIQPRTSVGVNFGETTVLGVGTAIGETTVLGVAQSLAVQPLLIRRKTDERIPLSKPVFRIGKEKSYVDYFIGDNTAISRSHANLIIREGEFFVVDTNSTNHTYVNGTMIQSNVEIQITHGDIIRLANEDFEFRLY